MSRSFKTVRALVKSARQYLKACVKMIPPDMDRVKIDLSLYQNLAFSLFRTQAKPTLVKLSLVPLSPNLFLIVVAHLAHYIFSSGKLNFSRID